MRRVRPEWDDYFSTMARWAAHRSPDDKTQVGCVIVRDRHIIGTGYNGTPAGFDDSAVDWFGDEKKQYVIHAEANAIVHANGTELRGATLYCTHSPCVNCALLIASAGIVRVVFEAVYRQDGLDLLATFGIEASQYVKGRDGIGI